MSIAQTDHALALHSQLSCHGVSRMFTAAAGAVLAAAQESLLTVRITPAARTLERSFLMKETISRGESDSSELVCVSLDIFIWGTYVCIRAYVGAG